AELNDLVAVLFEQGCRNLEESGVVDDSSESATFGSFVGRLGPDIGPDIAMGDPAAVILGVPDLGGHRDPDIVLVLATEPLAAVDRYGVLFEGHIHGQDPDVALRLGLPCLVALIPGLRVFTQPGVLDDLRPGVRVVANPLVVGDLAPFGYSVVDIPDDARSRTRVLAGDPSVLRPIEIET